VRPRIEDARIRQMFLDLLVAKVMEEKVDLGKKRNQAIKELTEYLAKKRRPQDERERLRLLGERR
jgi:hypothetical protein